MKICLLDNYLAQLDEDMASHMEQEHKIDHWVGGAIPLDLPTEDPVK